jgi:hypothetical protein
VLLDLLSKEDMFESALAVEQIEDKLIHKKISFLDESTSYRELVDSSGSLSTSHFMPVMCFSETCHDEANSGRTLLVT